MLKLQHGFKTFFLNHSAVATDYDTQNALMKMLETYCVNPFRSSIIKSGQFLTNTF